MGDKEEAGKGKGKVLRYWNRREWKRKDNERKGGGWRIRRKDKGENQ